MHRLPMMQHKQAQKLGGAPARPRFAVDLGVVDQQSEAAKNKRPQRDLARSVPWRLLARSICCGNAKLLSDEARIGLQTPQLPAADELTAALGHLSVASGASKVQTCCRKRQL